DTMPQELPLAAGQQESRPYMEGAHHAPVANMPGAGVAGQPYGHSSAPTHISTARNAAEHTNTTPTGQGGMITNIRGSAAPTQPAGSAGRGPVPFPTGVRPSGPNSRAMQMEMSMEEASMLNPKYIFDRF